jgi:hypothetical protein
LKSKTPNSIALLLGAATIGWVDGGCSPPASPYPDVTSFCAAKAKAECQVALVCAIDQGACAEYRAGLCEQDAANAIASGIRMYDSANVPACLAVLNSAYGNESSKILFDQLFGSGSITDLCERVFSGGVVKDDPCESDYDCSEELICSPVLPGSAMSICAPATDLTAGAYCSDPGSVCPTDTYCSNNGGAYECQPSAEAGAPCSSAPPCVSTERCVDAVCTGRAAAGLTCATNDDCAPEAPYCDPNAGNICTIGLTFAAGSFDCKAYLPGGPGAAPDGGSDASGD